MFLPSLKNNKGEAVISATYISENPLPSIHTLPLLHNTPSLHGDQLWLNSQLSVSWLLLCIPSLRYTMLAFIFSFSQFEFFFCRILTSTKESCMFFKTFLLHLWLLSFFYNCKKCVTYHSKEAFWECLKIMCTSVLRKDGENPQRKKQVLRMHCLDIPESKERAIERKMISHAFPSV